MRFILLAALTALFLVSAHADDAEVKVTPKKAGHSKKAPDEGAAKKPKGETDIKKEISEAAGEVKPAEKAGDKTTEAKPHETLAEPITIKVIKAKNGKALIRYTDKIKLEKKMKYTLSALHAPGDEPHEANRDWFLGASLDMGLFTQTVTVAASDSKIDYKSFSLNASYGRNWGVLEIGAFLEYAFQTVATNDARTVLAGLLIDINFGVNDVDADGILGLRLAAGFGTEETSNYPDPAKVMRLQPSLFYKWFGLSDSSAVVFELGFRNQTADYPNRKAVTTGPVGKLGVIGYF